MAPQTSLTDETGRVVFRGTQSPGGGSLPQGWTGDGANPENVTTNGGSIDATGGGIVAENVEAKNGFLAPGVGGYYLDAGSSLPRLVCGGSDPSTSGGFNASPGSLYIRTTGELWVKTGAAATDWDKVALAP